MAKGEIVINEGRCKGCGYCTYFCSHGCIVILGDRVTPMGYLLPVFVKPEKCSACCVCAWLCPELAIEVFKFVETASASAKEA